MPYDRNYVDAIRDVMTSPARVDAAFWDAIGALYGRNSVKAVWNTLFNPVAADPQDLQTFSERFLHLNNGFAKFVVDTATHPATLWGAAFSAGSGALRLMHEPGPISKTFIQMFDGLMPYGIQPYAKLLDKFGFKISRGADIVMGERLNRFLREYTPVYEDIAASFGKGDAWSKAKPRIALFLDGRSVAGITQQEVGAANRIRNEILDPIWDRIGTVQRESGGQFVGDPKPIGYITSYFMHMQDRHGWMAMNPGNIVRGMEANPIYRQLVGANQIKPLPFSTDSSISLAEHYDQLLDWMQQPAAARVFNASLLKRTADALPDPLFAQMNILDLDRVIPAYMKKAARTWALQTPIDTNEARVLHGIIQNAPVDVEQIPKIHSAIRVAYRQAELTGDYSEVERLRKQVEAVYDQVKANPFQHSLAVQVTNEARSVIPGFDPTATAGRRGHFSGIPDLQMKARARIFHEWYSNLIGKQDLERFKLAQMYSSMMAHIEPMLTPNVLSEIDAMGAKVGKPDLGQAIGRHVVEHQDTYTAAGIERKLVSYVTSNLLGLRPAALLVQLTQTPAMTVPDIGLGNTIKGMQEGLPKLYNAYRYAVGFYRQGKAANQVVTWRQALRAGFQKFLPEFEASGIPRDLSTFEHSFGEAFQPNGNFDLDKVTNAAMLPMSMGEHINRVINFYGARAGLKKALQINPMAFGYDAAKVTAEQLERDLTLHAASSVYDNQFVPSASRITPWQNKLGPVMRMFTTYPIGFANRLTDMAVKGAIDRRAEQVSATLGQAFGTGRSWLPYARYLAVMGGMVNFGRDVLGMNLGERVLEGVVNLPLGADQPFAPLPVPPIPGALIAAANATLTGHYEKGGFTQLPVVGEVPIPKAFFPFGVLVSQAARLINQTKDGMLLDREGRGLSNFDAKAGIAAMLSMKTTESVRDDEKAKRLLYTQAKVSGYRRRLAVALAAGDMATAGRVRGEYQSEYPDAQPLGVQRADILRVIEQQRTDRLSRLAKTVGAGIRGIVDPTIDPNGWFEPDERILSNARFPN